MNGMYIRYIGMPSTHGSGLDKNDVSFAQWMINDYEDEPTQTELRAMLHMLEYMGFINIIRMWAEQWYFSLEFTYTETGKQEARRGWYQIHGEYPHGV